MGRYIFKPLIYSEENKEEFLEKYKESLQTGELLVDLKDYDIFISNAGLEYPIPVTSEIRNEIINWIENEEGPLVQYKMNELLTEKTEDATEANIKRKKELIENLKKEIDKYRKLFSDNTDDTENGLMRINRECNYFYRDLASYTLTMVTDMDSYIKDVKKLINEILLRYLNAHRRFREVKQKIYSIKNTIDNIEPTFEESLKEDFKKTINMGVSLNSKMDKSLLSDDKLPTYEVTLKFKFSSSDHNDGSIVAINEDIDPNGTIEVENNIDDNTITYTIKS